MEKMTEGKNTQSDFEYVQKSDVLSKNMQILDNVFRFSDSKGCISKNKDVSKNTKPIMNVYRKI